jgi:hypothetical protein
VDVAGREVVEPAIDPLGGIGGGGGSVRCGRRGVVVTGPFTVAVVEIAAVEIAAWQEVGEWVAFPLLPQPARAGRRSGDAAVVARKGIESSDRLGLHRWVIERTISWLTGYHRLNIRYDRKATHSDMRHGLSRYIKVGHPATCPACAWLTPTVVSTYGNTRYLRGVCGKWLIEAREVVLATADTSTFADSRGTPGAATDRI